MKLRAGLDQMIKSRAGRAFAGSEQMRMGLPCGAAACVGNLVEKT
ncbi:hypothetical protein D8I24_3625 [Cupriavidus necator H850]|nr:hypothetical protein D8I24_3625 [Cupriavidus necator H850]